MFALWCTSLQQASRRYIPRSITSAPVLQIVGIIGSIWFLEIGTTERPTFDPFSISEKTADLDLDLDLGLLFSAPGMTITIISAKKSERQAPRGERASTHTAQHLFFIRLFNLTRQENFRVVCWLILLVFRRCTNRCKSGNVRGFFHLEPSNFLCTIDYRPERRNRAEKSNIRPDPFFRGFEPIYLPHGDHEFEYLSKSLEFCFLKATLGSEQKRKDEKGEKKRVWKRTAFI